MGSCITRGRLDEPCEYLLQAIGRVNLPIYRQEPGFRPCGDDTEMGSGFVTLTFDNDRQVNADNFISGEKEFSFRIHVCKPPSWHVDRDANVIFNEDRTFAERWP